MSKFDFKSFIKDGTLEKLASQRQQILKESYEYHLANKASRDYHQTITRWMQCTAWKKDPRAAKRLLLAWRSM